MQLTRAFSNVKPLNPSRRNHSSVAESILLSLTVRYLVRGRISKNSLSLAKGL